MPALLLSALLCAAPPAEADPPTPVERPEAGPVEGPAPPSEGPAPPPEDADPPPGLGPDAELTPREDPPLDEAPPALPVAPPRTEDPEAEVQPETVPAPALDPEDSEPPIDPVPPTADPPGPPPEPEALEDEPAYAERSWEDMPYAPTAARKSAVQRNNDVLVRPFNKPVYTIAGAARFATSLIGGREVIQPFGFGFAAQLRIHFLRVFRSRLGVEVYAGYTRFPERVDYQGYEGGGEITRLDLLAHTDVSAGPSMQIPIGPVFLQFGGSAGVGFSTLTRTQSIEAVDDELLTSPDFLLRGGLSLGVPVLSRHGLTLGAAVQHVFSRDEVPVDLTEPEGEQAQPFGTWLEIHLGYQMWF